MVEGNLVRNLSVSFQQTTSPHGVRFLRSSSICFATIWRLFHKNVTPLNVIHDMRYIVFEISSASCLIAEKMTGNCVC